VLNTYPAGELCPSNAGVVEIFLETHMHLIGVFVSLVKEFIRLCSA
jgi:hypothetical protein